MKLWSTDRCSNKDVPQKYYTSERNQKEKKNTLYDSIYTKYQENVSQSEWKPI